jgi:short-subunit dehydrogenase
MPALDSDIEEGKRLFEVNFWGVLRVVQAFSSLLIEAKGTVVTIGSGAGLVHMPYMSTSVPASKTSSHGLNMTKRYI